VTTHAKLVVVDRREVILGSTNWNRYAFTDQEQANVRIVDERVGGAFASYFDRLWEGSFGGEGMTFSLEVRRGVRLVLRPALGGVLRGGGDDLQPRGTISRRSSPFRTVTA